MNTRSIIKRIIDISQYAGWNVEADDKELSNVQFDFQRYTKFGQDFNFGVNMLNGNIDSLISNIEHYYEGFDPDYEASLWIGEDGHGKHGAPYHIKDIVTDMEDAEDKIYELIETLRLKALNH